MCGLQCNYKLACTVFAVKSYLIRYSKKILCGMYSTLFLFLFFPVKTLSGLQFLVRSLDSLQDGSKFSFAGTSSRSISLFFLSWNWCVVYYVFFVSAYRSSEVHY